MFLAQGHLQESFLVNPMFFFLYTGLLCWGGIEFCLTLTKKKVRLTFSRAEMRLIRVGVAAFVAANWLYLILSGAVERYHL